MTSADSQSRFSDRVADYVRHRPNYPAQLVEILRREAGLKSDAVIADIGSGTGISAALFLQAGFVVVGVEPNADMRAAAEKMLSPWPRFRSVAAPAEATGLGNASVDLVIAAQAFHWFDRPKTKNEFARILRPPKHVALIWNDRLASGTAFLDGYEKILTSLGTDYINVNHRGLTEEESEINAFFDGRVRRFDLPNHQDLDETGLVGRAFSSSYTPKVGDPNREKMEQSLRRLFADTAQDGVVRMAYVTRIYLGSLM